MKTLTASLRTFVLPFLSSHRVTPASRNERAAAGRRTTIFPPSVETAQALIEAQRKHRSRRPATP